MLRITGGKVYDPANGIDGEVQDICIADGRIVADVEGGRTIDATGMVVFPGGVDIHTHVAGAALNFARAHDAREPARKAAPFLHTPERRVRASAARRPPPSPPATSTPAWATRRSTRRRCRSCRAKHTHEELRDTPHRRQGLLRADGQQRDRAGPARGRRDRARQARRRLADLGGQGLRRQGGQPRRRRRLEVGQGRQGALRAGRRLQQGDAGEDHRRPGRHRRRAGPAAPAAPALQQPRHARATSPPRSRR